MTLSYSCTLSVTVLTLWVAPTKMFHIGFNGAETNFIVVKLPTDDQLRLLDISRNNNFPSSLNY